MDQGSDRTLKPGETQGYLLWRLACDRPELLGRVKVEHPRQTGGMPAITFSEAARRLPVSMVTLYRWRNNGLLAPPYLLPDGRQELEPPGQQPLAEFCEAVVQVQIRC